MANIPGISGASLPGVFGPGGSEIIKTNQGYAIGYTGMEYWGGPWAAGSIQDIALQALRVITRMPKSSWYIVIGFNIALEPAVVCKFEDRLRIDKDINQEEFLAELTQEIIRLQKISAFI